MNVHGKNVSGLKFSLKIYLLITVKKKEWQRGCWLQALYIGILLIIMLGGFFSAMFMNEWYMTK